MDPSEWLTMPVVCTDSSWSVDQMRVCHSIAIAAVFVAAAGVDSRAQGAQRVGRIPIPYRTYIGLNPAIVPFSFGSAEFETGIAQGMTMGGSLSYADIRHDRWTSADFKMRYYPSEVVLSGLSLGLTAGYLRYSTTTGNVPDRQELTAPTAGIEADYNWLLGGTNRFLVGTGGGAKRLLARASERARVDQRAAYLTARFILGVAF